jgi:energy-coupling factor transport system permease protein
LVPIVGPVILGSLAEVEERSLALEARAVSRPGRRSLLWWPADRTIERIARWLLALSVPAVIALRIAGWLD